MTPRFRRAPRDTPLAMDKSARTFDVDGHMRVLGSAVSMSNVCGYVGAEISGYQALGLDPNKIYQLYRDPASLAASADSLNGKPLLITHKVQVSDSHDHDLVVGSLDNARWDTPFLRADMTIWDQAAIDVIKSGQQRALSCGYRYVPTMKRGVATDGTPYDGIMTQIAMNHCALVTSGRVDGAYVGDAAITTRRNPKPKWRPIFMATDATETDDKQIMANLTAFLQDRLSAEDMKSVEAILDGQTPPPTEAAMDAARRVTQAQRTAHVKSYLDRFPNSERLR